MFLSEIFGPDLLVVVIAGAVLLFGGAAIPKFARHLGQSKSEFEKGMKSVKEIADYDASKSVTHSNPTDTPE
ncbi:MAG TPA: twin-arginine translocase TatA/TatE family subunit [Acidimicrobiales bacterium]|jgi:Sec-independent protein translocase protein TatA